MTKHSAWKLAIPSLIAAAAAAFLVIRLDERAGPAIIIRDPSSERSIVVAVSGAVARTGAYRLPGDARVQDAIDAAGGLGVGADLSGINLAQRLPDEAQLSIPTFGTPEIAYAASAGTPIAAQRAPATAPTRIAPRSGGALNVNNATTEELIALPEIGPALAGRIIAYRTAHGGFRSIDDLALVTGISPKMVAKLAGLVTVGP